MTNRLFALTLALLFTFTQAGTAAAGTPKAPAADWSAVQALSPGEKVRVDTKDGDRLKGRFESADDADINFTVDGRRVTLRRDSIRRVEVGRRNRLNGALLGAGIGGGAGLGLGFGLVGIGGTYHYDMSIIPTGAFVGAGVGAAVGAAAGLGTVYQTVYESL